MKQHTHHHMCLKCWKTHTFATFLREHKTKLLKNPRETHPPGPTQGQNDPSCPQNTTVLENPLLGLLIYNTKQRKHQDRPREWRFGTAVSCGVLAFVFPCVLWWFFDIEGTRVPATVSQGVFSACVWARGRQRRGCSVFCMVHVFCVPCQARCSRTGSPPQCGRDGTTRRQRKAPRTGQDGFWRKRCYGGPHFGGAQIDCLVVFDTRGVHF